MMLTNFSPDPRLQQFIKGYWLLESVDGNDIQENSFFPVGAVEIVFHFKASFLRPQNNVWAPEHRAFIEGQQTGQLRVKQQGAMKTFGITLYPWATGDVFNISPSAFTNNRFALHEVDKSMSDLHDKLLYVTDDKHYAKQCDAYFLSLINKRQRSYSANDLYIIDMYHRSAGDVHQVRSLKEQWNFSSRYFEQRFNDVLGVNAKDLLKKRRMKKALDITFGKYFRSFTDVAHAAGYYDQSHFIKDFKFYFDRSPLHLRNQQNSLLKTFM